jgi:hypothetical protein
MKTTIEGDDDEAGLVSLYRDLTGASESTARSVFMYVCCRENGNGRATGQNEFGLVSAQAPASNVFSPDVGTAKSGPVTALAAPAHAW